MFTYYKPFSEHSYSLEIRAGHKYSEEREREIKCKREIEKLCVGVYVCVVWKEEGGMQRSVQAVRSLHCHLEGILFGLLNKVEIND